MSNGTALVNGAYLEFQAAVLKALPRNLTEKQCLRWANDGETLTRFLSGLDDKEEKPKENSTETPILHLLSSPGEIILPETDGTRTLAKAEDTFSGWLDPDFKNWGTDVAGEKSGKLTVSLYEMRRDATFRNMFTSLSSDLDRLVLPQDKIIEFCEKHRNHLGADGYATFFLFKVGGEFFVAYVYFDDRGRLKARVGRFGGDGVWRGDYRHRVVVPKL